jgi:RNA polymerase sigma factor (sigma-70 family)
METTRAQADSTDLGVAFRRHMPWLHRRITLIVGDPEEASDIVQEVFLRALRRWPLGSPDEVAGWCSTVGIRLAIDEIRRRRRWGFLQLRETHAEWALQVDPDLWHAIQGLKPAVRAALLLTTLDGYSQDEVALALGVPRGTVASWLSRARDQLRPVVGSSPDER